MPSKHLKLKCDKMDLSPDPNNHPACSLPHLDHYSFYFSQTHRLSGSPTFKVYPASHHCDPSIIWCFTHIIRVPSLTRFLLLLPLKCALHTPARGSLLRKKLDGVILKSFTRSISKSTHNGTQVSTWDSPLIF